MANLLGINLFHVNYMHGKCDFVNNSISYRNNSPRKLVAIDFHDSDYFQILNQL